MPSLENTFVVLNPDQSVQCVPVTPTVYEELDQRFDHFKGRALVAAYSFTEDWPGWEVHPNGDEVVALVSGKADLVLREAGGERVVTLGKPGEFVIVPRGTWHTARISRPTMMFFVTPGEGTTHEKRS
jgi:mannose-6-phosphate isomerase-like protein (cupin superfamily)